jgi:hypothetical protein
MMRLAVAIVADAAIANPRDGKLYVLGGGIDTLEFERFPAQLPALSLAVKLEFAPAECGRQHTLEVQLLDPDGTPMIPKIVIPMTPLRNPTDATLPSAAQWVINFQQLAIAGPAENAFSLVVDGQEIASLPLRVVQAPARADGG